MVDDWPRRTLFPTDLFWASAECFREGCDLNDETRRHGDTWDRKVQRNHVVYTQRVRTKHDHEKSSRSYLFGLRLTRACLTGFRLTQPALCTDKRQTAQHEPPVVGFWNDSGTILERFWSDSDGSGANRGARSLSTVTGRGARLRTFLLFRLRGV